VGSKRNWFMLRIARVEKERSVAGIPEIVRLGEDLFDRDGIHVFLVLENDAEYQRLEITSRNLESTGRDRQAQAEGAGTV